jgi:hypothetical protein
MIEFSNILINLEGPIGYPAHTGLISLSVCPFVHMFGIQKMYIFNVGIKVKKCHLSIFPYLRIPIPMLLYCKLVSNTKNYFLPQPKIDTTAHHMSIPKYTCRCTWAGGSFFQCLRKVPPAQAQQVFEVKI